MSPTVGGRDETVVAGQRVELAAKVNPSLTSSSTIWRRMSNGVQPADLGFFSALASAGSLSAAARELGITTPAVSKHLALMEVATRRVARQPHHAAHEPHARGRAVPGAARGASSAKSTSMEELLGVAQGDAEGAAARSMRRWASGAATWRR